MTTETHIGDFSSGPIMGRVRRTYMYSTHLSVLYTLRADKRLGYDHPTSIVPSYDSNYSDKCLWSLQSEIVRSPSGYVRIATELLGRELANSALKNSVPQARSSTVVDLLTSLALEKP